MSERYVYAATGQVEGRTLSGVVHVYGSVTMDGRAHSFAKGAFAKSIAAGDVKSFAWHGDKTVALLGSQRAGTLRLEDGAELKFSLDLPETSDGNDLRVLKERGEEIGMSFQVIPVGKPVRRGGVTTWAEGRLLSVDPVAMPAFGGTNVQLNSSDLGETTESILAKLRARRLASLGA